MRERKKEGLRKDNKHKLDKEKREHKENDQLYS
mgnify:CR=1 FL=1